MIPGLSMALLVALLLAPGPLAPISKQQPAPGGVRDPATYRVGPGDILEVTVHGREDLSRSVTVKNSGVISMPLVGDVAVGEMTVGEIDRKLENLLAGDFVDAPQIDVEVAEYWNQLVSVTGEVNRPGRKTLRGRTRLVDVLIASGGFTPSASGEVAIRRREGVFADGGKTLRMFLGRSPTLQDQVSLSVVLEPGDVISASPQYHVMVQGEVLRPGSLAIEGELSLTRAISLVGGVTRFADTQVTVRRREPAGGDMQLLELDLKAIRSGEQPDPILLPNDVVTVGSRAF